MNNCPNCGHGLKCAGGEPAHPDNLYCPKCNWEAWNNRGGQMSPIGKIRQLTTDETGAMDEALKKSVAIIPDRRIKELEAENKVLTEQLRRWRHDENQIGTKYQIRQLKAENRRLLILAIKHCPHEHHDWKEVLQIIGATDMPSVVPVKAGSAGNNVGL